MFQFCVHWGLIKLSVILSCSVCEIVVLTTIKSQNWQCMRCLFFSLYLNLFIFLVWVCVSLYCFLVFTLEISHPTSMASRLVFALFCLSLCCWNPFTAFFSRFSPFVSFHLVPLHSVWSCKQFPCLSWHIDLFVFCLTPVHAQFSSFAFLLFHLSTRVQSEIWDWLFARL